MALEALLSSVARRGGKIVVDLSAVEPTRLQPDTLMRVPDLLASAKRIRGTRGIRIRHEELEWARPICVDGVPLFELMVLGSIMDQLVQAVAERGNLVYDAEQWLLESSVQVRPGQQAAREERRVVKGSRDNSERSHSRRDNRIARFRSCRRWEARQRRMVA